VEDELNISQTQLDLNRLRLHKASLKEMKWSRLHSSVFKISAFFYLVCLISVLVIQILISGEFKYEESFLQYLDAHFKRQDPLLDMNYNMRMHELYVK
jgi:hypothetical protein